MLNMRDLIEPLSSGDLLARAIQTFDDLLPEEWETSLTSAAIDPYADRRIAPEALLEVAAPDGSTAVFAIAAKLTFTGRDVAPTLSNLKRWSDQHDTLPLVVARYLSTTVRERLTAQRASFLDACGNVSVASPSPAVALSQTGLDHDPWRQSTTRSSLRGEPAALVVRALCEFATPMPIAQLIELAGTSAGSTYRVLDLLLDEGLATKGERGWVESVDVPALLRRWANDWVATESRFVLSFESDDGLEGTLKRLAKQPRDAYVLGGGHAAALAADVRRPRAAVIHCDDVVGLMSDLHARPARHQSAADLFVHGRGLGAAMMESATVDKLVLAAPSQAYADLVLTGESESAETLLRALTD